MKYSTVEIESVASKRYGTRSAQISAVIIHDVTIEEGTLLTSFDQVLDFFVNTEQFISAHYFVDSSKVVRMVNESNRAYHAGKSILNGIEDVNQFSIGIELIRYKGEDFTDFQYGWLAWKVAQLMKEYSFDLRQVSTHEIIRMDYRTMALKYGDPEIPNIKSDPHGLNWDRFIRLVLQA